jgi:hypothetical protein
MLKNWKTSITSSWSPFLKLIIFWTIKSVTRVLLKISWEMKLITRGSWWSSRLLKVRMINMTVRSSKKKIKLKYKMGMRDILIKWRNTKRKDLMSMLITNKGENCLWKKMIIWTLSKMEVKIFIWTKVKSSMIMS